MQNNILFYNIREPLNNLYQYVPILFKRDIIPLPVLIPRVEKNKIFYENGLSRIIPKLQLKVISDIEMCKELWEKFCYHESLFDLWDIRKSFWQAYQYPIYFYTLFEDSVPIGVLPLQYDTDDNVFHWFGGTYMEDNKFFINDLKLINIFLKILPRPLKITGIEPIFKNDLYINLFEIDDAKYIKNLSSFLNIDEYIASLRKKTRYNLKRDIKNIELLNPKINIEEPNDDLADEITKLMRLRFADEEQTKKWLFSPKLNQTFKKIISNKGIYGVKFIRVIINDRLAGLDMVFSYKDTVYSLGANSSHIFSGVGNYMTYLNLKYAIENGFKKLDYFQEDCGYKHRYFDQSPMWKIVLK